MSDIAEVEQLDSEPFETTSPEELRAALNEATDAGKRLPPAMKSLERALGKASVARMTQHAPELAIVREKLVALVAEMRAARLMTLEMAHFLEHWHPIGPSFGQQARSRARL